MTHVARTSTSFVSFPREMGRCRKTCLSRAEAVFAHTLEVDPNMSVYQPTASDVNVRAEEGFVALRYMEMQPDDELFMVLLQTKKFERKKN